MNEKNMKQNPVVVFVCEHGAAKSILAAAYFNQQAREKHLGLSAIARGLHPDLEISSKTIAGLLEDGLTPTESIPTKLTRAETTSARLVFSFCRLPEDYRQNANIEYWNGIPPVSEDYIQARDAILERLRELSDRL